MSTPIPTARDDDPEDVSWALSTAATSFARGDPVEALKWLRRAAEAASEAEHDARALELAKAAAELSTLPATPVRASRPPPSASRPPPSASRTPPPPAARPSAAPEPPAPTPSRPPPLPSRPPPPPRSVEAKGKAGHGGRGKASKSKAEEGGKRGHRGRSQPAQEEYVQTREMLASEAPQPRAQSPQAGVVSAADADSWPTQTNEPAGLVYGQQRTRIGPAYKPSYKDEAPRGAALRASQAIRVILWRGPDGALRVAPQGTAVSAVSIEAVLVALEPDADLLAWLTPD